VFRRRGPPLFASDQFTFEQLGAGVWAAIAKPSAGASSNCGIVDIGRSTLVFDTSMTPRSAGQLRAGARILSGKEPLEVANSHWHFGHTLGNRVFGGSTIRGTRAMQDLLLRNGGITASVHDPGWSHAAGEVEARRDRETRPLHREELATEAAARRDLAEFRDAVELRPPDELFADRYVYPGGRDVMLVAGAGHSESDTVLWVPDGEVMFAGDLVVESAHPDLRSANVDRWLATLTRIETTKPRRIVPGHGPVTDVGACARLAEYLRLLPSLAREGPEPETPEEYRGWARPSLFRQNVAALRARPLAPS
jgi:cyclase